MAKKLFLLCASLAFCVLLANASIYRTIVEFDEDDATNPSGRGRGGSQQIPQRCQREFREAEHLQGCQKWIQHKMRQGRRGGRGGIPAIVDDEIDLDLDLDFEDDFENRRGSGSPQRHPLLQQCCQELRQEDPVCVCPTLKQVAQSQAQRYEQQQGQGQGQGQGQHQVRRIFKTASNLPQICNVPQVRSCPFQSPSPYY